MKPFFLRRLKSEVLTQLPKKKEKVTKVPLTPSQHELYAGLVADYRERAKAVSEAIPLARIINVIKIENGAPRDPNESGVGLLMNLRKAANHPLLIRSHYNEELIRKLARKLKKLDSGHREANVKFIEEDLSVMHDFAIHKTCLAYRVSVV